MTRRDPDEREQTDRDVLASLVERYSLARVLGMLSGVAAENAFHSSGANARDWDQTSRLMGRAAEAIRRLGSRI